MEQGRVILSLATVLLAVVTFLDMSNRLYLFPVIFVLGGTANVLGGLEKLSADGTKERRPVQAVLHFVGAVILFMLMALSMLTIWL